MGGEWGVRGVECRVRSLELQGTIGNLDSAMSYLAELD